MGRRTAKSFQGFRLSTVDCQDSWHLQEGENFVQMGRNVAKDHSTVDGLQLFLEQDQFPEHRRSQAVDIGEVQDQFVLPVVFHEAKELGSARLDRLLGQYSASSKPHQGNISYLFNLEPAGRVLFGGLSCPRRAALGNARIPERGVGGGRRNNSRRPIDKARDHLERLWDGMATVDHQTMPRVPLGVQEMRTKTKTQPEASTATAARRAVLAESLPLTETLLNSATSIT
jgi:hypothetical protein